MADSVYIPTYLTPGSLINEGYKAGYDIREGERKKALNNIFSQSVNPDGSFNSENFLTKAAAANVGPELVSTWLNQKTAKSDAATKEAENAYNLETMNRRPDVLRDWFEQEKQRKETQEAATNYGLQQEQAAKQAILDKQTGADQFLHPSVGNTELPQEHTQPKINTNITTDKQGNMDLGEGLLTGSVGKSGSGTFTATDPGYYGAGGLEPKIGTNTIPQDRKYDVVEEALRRVDGGTGTYGIGIESVENPVKYDLMGGNKRYVNQYLSKIGLPANQEGIDAAWELYKSAVPKPTVKGKDGKIDRFATEADKARYNADLREASKKFLSDIASGNTTTISEALAQSSNAREIEKQEYALAGQKDKLTFARPVSEAEAARVKVLNETVDDVINAKSIGGFEGDYQAAVAKAKADGSVNRDVIVANLIAMGSVPSSQAVFIKGILDSDGSPTGDFWKYLKTEAAKRISDETKRAAWYKGAVGNMNESLVRNGGISRSMKTDAEKFVGGKGKDVIKTKVKEGSKENPIQYTKGMKTYKGKWYNVGGVLAEGKN